MPHGDEGIPLRLLARRDGVLLLRTHQFATDQAAAEQQGLTLAFPRMHEFSTEWLIENTMDGTVQLSKTEVVLNLGNGRAVYKIRRDLMEEEITVDSKEMAVNLGKAVGDAHTRKLSTGYWGELVDAEYFDPPALDASVYDNVDDGVVEAEVTEEDSDG